tara:strand:+ start:5152 stop:6423 length:1272 start_codon:yes stop_codon:yes gene_type:complete
MANWKIRDIAPPKKQEPQKKAEAESEKKVLQSSKPKRRKRMPVWLSFGVPILLVATLGGILVIHFFFAKAQVQVHPVTREINIQETIAAEVGREQMQKEDNIIPASTLSVEKEATRPFPASSTTIKENRARGTIRVYNAYTTSLQLLIANTRFISEEGKLFRTPVRITIPGAKDEGGKLTPGFLDIEVVAAEPGADYNIGPSNFSLPGLSGSPSYTAIYAKSTEPMTRGSEREVSVVSANDIENAKEALIQELSEKAKEELLLKVPEQMAASAESVEVVLKEASSLVKEGAELDQFNVSVSLEATAYLFLQTDLDEIAKKILQPELQEGERFFEERTKIDFQDVVFSEEKGKLTFDLHVSALAYHYIDPTELKVRIRSKSAQEAKDVLAGYSTFSESEISLWPFWITSLPGNVDKVQIKVIVD